MSEVSFGKGMPKGRVGSGSDDARGRPGLNCNSKIILTYFIPVSLIKVFSTKIQYRKYISSHPFLVFKEGLQGVKNSMRGIVKVRVVFK